MLDNKKTIQQYTTGTNKKTKCVFSVRTDLG